METPILLSSDSECPVVISSDSECPADTLDFISDADSSESVSSQHLSDYAEHLLSDYDASNEDTDDVFSISSTSSSDSNARGVTKSSE